MGLRPSGQSPQSEIRVSGIRAKVRRTHVTVRRTLHLETLAPKTRLRGILWRAFRVADPRFSDAGPRLAHSLDIPRPPPSVPHPHLRSRAISRDSPEVGRVNPAACTGACCATSHGTLGPGPTPKSRSGPGVSPPRTSRRAYIGIVVIASSSACTCGNAWITGTRQARVPGKFPMHILQTNGAGAALGAPRFRDGRGPGTRKQGGRAPTALAHL